MTTVPKATYTLHYLWIIKTTVANNRINLARVHWKMWWSCVSSQKAWYRVSGGESCG